MIGQIFPPARRTLLAPQQVISSPASLASVAGPRREADQAPPVRVCLGRSRSLALDRAVRWLSWERQSRSEGGGSLHPATQPGKVWSFAFLFPGSGRGTRAKPHLGAVPLPFPFLAIKLIRAGVFQQQFVVSRRAGSPENFFPSLSWRTLGRNDQAVLLDA